MYWFRKYLILSFLTVLCMARTIHYSWHRGHKRYLLNYLQIQHLDACNILPSLNVIWVVPQLTLHIFKCTVKRRCKFYGFVKVTLLTWYEFYPRKFRKRKYVASIQPIVEGTAKYFIASYKAIIWNMIFKAYLLTTPLISKIILRRR
jgi:hypothetical protein